MPADFQTESEFEIAHVLCTDIVGYSKLMIDQQSDYLQKLNEVVRKTEPFQRADANGKLLRIPTGDGMVLVFFTHPQDPAECAVQIAQGLKAYPEIQLRMGVHSGPVNRVRDVNERSNVAGAGINIGQRVMDCGDAGHILVSKRVAEDLGHYTKWRPCLHQLAEFEVKHGVKVDIVNLYGDDFGNPLRPQKLQRTPTKAPGFRDGIGRFVGAAVVIVAVALVGFILYRNREVSAPSTATIFPGKSVAIAPFKPLVASNRDEVLEAGMADTLINKLSTSREIVIPSLSLVRKYEAQDPVAMGRELHVNTVLEGNVQKSGDRIRVTARLIKVADGSSLWAGTFDEKFTDVFAVQDTIAQKVASALALRLSEEEQQRLTKRYTDNTDAYQLYLKGRFHWNKYTEESFRKSIGYFEQALAKDPNYALAYSGLADSYSLLGEMAYAPAHDSFPRGRSYAEQALRLDDTVASAHLSLAIVKLFYDWDLAGAGRQLSRAKQLDPHNPQIYHFNGHYLELVGRPKESIEETARGLALEPTNMILNSELAYAYYLSRDPDAAISQARKTLQLDPTYSYASCILAWSLGLKGMYQEALSELNKARIISDPPDWSWIIAEIAYVNARIGNHDTARQLLQELKGRTTREYIDPAILSYIHIGLGEADEAFAWMEKAYQEHSGAIGWLQVEPKFDPVRSDPRFTALVQRMGLKDPLTANAAP
jgi:TolB-like protein/Flp pilus assembly protein TadD